MSERRLQLRRAGTHQPALDVTTVVPMIIGLPTVRCAINIWQRRRQMEGSQGQIGILRVRTVAVVIILANVVGLNFLNSGRLNLLQGRQLLGRMLIVHNKPTWQWCLRRLR